MTTPRATGRKTATLPEIEGAIADIVLDFSEEKKGSNLYRATTPDPAITSVYLMKSAVPQGHQKVRVVVIPVE